MSSSENAGRVRSNDGAVSKGVRLSSGTATYFGRLYGHDFSSVRVHTDTQADDIRHLRAQAFTLGSDIYFAPGQYEPDTTEGRRLIAHELAHVVQQQGHHPAGMTPDRFGETVANDAVQHVLAGRSATVPARTPSGPQLDDGGPATGAPRQAPLTPDELWKVAQSVRGFESTSGGKGDDYRSKPAALPQHALEVDETGRLPKGAPLGKGYETVAAVQVLDAEGSQVAIGTGIFHGCGTDDHAEARAVRGLDRDTPARIEGGKLVVVGDQMICPTCRARLLIYAESRGLTVIEPHEPSRAKVRGTGTVSPKTASRSSTQGEMPALFVVRRLPISVSSSGGDGRAAAPSKRLSAPPKAPNTRSTDSTVGSTTPPRTETLRKGTVSIKLESGGKQRLTLQEIDASGLSVDKGTHLSKSPSGAALVHAYSAARIGRQLLEFGATSSDSDTAKKILRVTHPLESYLLSKVTDAEHDFLADHPDPSSLKSHVDAGRLRGVYEAAWMRLSAPQGARILMAIAVAITPEEQRGNEWHQAAEYVRQGTAGVNPADLEAFRSAASAYQSRMIDTLQEVAEYRPNLPQLAGEIEQRANVLGRIANDLEEVWFMAIQRMPLAFYVVPDLLGEAGLIRQLSSRMSLFAATVRSRDRAYERVDEEFHARLLQVEKHLDNPRAAASAAMRRRMHRR
ncbi:DUF4157 domain-containing protein [Isoptericola sp. b408]|uniref:eCIS core domain-containing protein n=1 Tax=Isoptericola sp. b408 TaxID=3064653 RepID=UPI00271388B3|nr:DUF4157 domain-containing protein [Isoptericola sp. b408]MDO8152624.1 DUF4157 domain-containing protein [Isoptericola sp. b408]